MANVTVRLDPAAMRALLGGDPVVAYIKGLTEDALREARNRAPVRTGTFRRGLSAQVRTEDGLPVGYVSAASGLAGLIELGTVRTPPHPTLRPAGELVARNEGGTFGRDDR